MATQLNLNTEKIEKIKTQVQSINDTANTQATTISEIAALLEGKSVPGGGGASIETCSVTINANILRARATTYNNGVFAIAEDMGGESTVTFDNVVKGSMVIVVVYGISSPTFTNATQYEQFYMDDFAMNYIYIAIAG